MEWIQLFTIVGIVSTLATAFPQTPVLPTFESEKNVQATLPEPNSDEGEKKSEDKSRNKNLGEIESNTEQASEVESREETNNSHEHNLYQLPEGSQVLYPVYVDQDGKTVEQPGQFFQGPLFQGFYSQGTHGGSHNTQGGSSAAAIASTSGSSASASLGHGSSGTHGRPPHHHTGVFTPAGVHGGPAYHNGGGHRPSSGHGIHGQHVQPLGGGGFAAAGAINLPPGFHGVPIHHFGSGYPPVGFHEVPIGYHPGFGFGGFSAAGALATSFGPGFHEPPHHFGGSFPPTGIHGAPIHHVGGSYPHQPIHGTPIHGTHNQHHNYKPQTSHYSRPPHYSGWGPHRELEPLLVINGLPNFHAAGSVSVGEGSASGLGGFSSKPGAPLVISVPAAVVEGDAHAEGSEHSERPFVQLIHRPLQFIGSILHPPSHQEHSPPHPSGETHHTSPIVTIHDHHHETVHNHHQDNIHKPHHEPEHKPHHEPEHKPHHEKPHHEKPHEHVHKPSHSPATAVHNHHHGDSFVAVHNHVHSKPGDKKPEHNKLEGSVAQPVTKLKPKQTGKADSVIDSADALKEGENVRSEPVKAGSTDTDISLTDKTDSNNTVSADKVEAAARSEPESDAPELPADDVKPVSETVKEDSPKEPEAKKEELSRTVPDEEVNSVASSDSAPAANGVDTLNNENTVDAKASRK